MGDDELKKQEHLKPQNAATVDPTKLTALTPEVVRLLHVVGLRNCISEPRSRKFSPHWLLLLSLNFLFLSCRFLVKPP